MRRALFHRVHDFPADGKNLFRLAVHRDRKSTRLNSSHGYISYAVFCLKKKNQTLEEQEVDNHINLIIKRLAANLHPPLRAKYGWYIVQHRMSLSPTEPAEAVLTVSLT